MRKYLLSELYGRIGQILQEHGDIEIVRDKIQDVDRFDNQSLNQVNLNRECFKPFILKNKESKVIVKKFVINVLVN